MQEESLFLAALDLPTAADRAAFLADACGDDPRLRARLEQLLAASERPSGILDAAAATEGPGAGPVGPLLATGQTFAERFVLRRKLGAGGMGEVWAAEQTAPVRRTVALKVIRPGVNWTADLARFDQERQALAVMDHPHIAKVFDAGVVGDMPYLAMELVEGVPITAHCDTRQLTLRQRLELFVPVCLAVQHAHQKGVIHRDLKPANVLVADVDGRAAPKVIDFGIAKAAGVKLTEDTLKTEDGSILGTLEYMAPEQAGGGADVDTRADIYALGVILYQLLTGTTPIRWADHAEGGMYALLRAVQEDEPQPPSRRSAAVGNDLDWVVMKCLEKERGRRYDTAAALARDLERYLADEVVEARPPSASYRARKFVRRNRPQVIAAAATLIALLAGGAVATWQAIRATSAQTRALQDRDAKGVALQAEADARKETRRQLWKSQLHRAAAITQSNMPGQRSASLAQLREALATAGDFELTEEDRREFRNVAVAALGLPELEVVKEWEGYPSGSHHITADARLERYARADAKGAVSVRRVADDRQLYQLPGTGRPAQVSLSDDGQLLAVASDNGTGHVYQLDGPEPKRLLTTKMDGGRTPHFTRDGGRLVYVAGGAIRAWNRATENVQSWPLPGRPWGSSALSPDGKVFAISCDRPAAVHIRRLDGDDAGFDLPIPAPIDGFAWHPDGKVLAAFHNLRIRLWDVEARRELGTLVGHSAAGAQLAFDATGERLFSNDWQGLLRVWDWRGGKQLMPFPAGWAINDRMTASDGQHLFAHGPMHATLRVLRCTPGRERRALGRPSALGSDALADPQGRYVFISGAGRTIVVDPDTGEERGRLPPEARPFHLTPTGELLTAGKLGHFWWPRTDDLVNRVTRFGPPEWIGHPYGGAAETNGASSDGRVVAVPNYSAGAVALHRNLGGVPAPTGRQDNVRTAAVSPDGRWVATGSHECPSGIGAKVWNAQTGALEREFQVPGLCLVSFSPDRRWLATSGGALRLWHVDTWQEGPRLPDAAAAFGWTFAPVGDILAIGGHGAVRLVRPSTGVELARLPLPGQGKFLPRCFAADGSRLYVTDLETGGVLVWDLRLLRQGLAELGLDWDAPAFPPAETATREWRVEFIDAKQVENAWKVTVDAAYAKPLDVTIRTRLAAMATDPNAVRQHASLALLLNASRVDARYYRAQANLRLKKYAEAMADADAVLRVVPGHVDATRVRTAAEVALKKAAKSPP